MQADLQGVLLMRAGRLRKQNAQAGMVMTEVIIAFLLLTIIFGMLYHCIRFSSQMMGRAADMGRENCYFEAAVAKEFQKDQPTDTPYQVTPVSGSPKITFKDAANNSYAITVSTAQKKITYKKADLTTDAEQMLDLYTY